jgi:hypothetical protein
MKSRMPTEVFAAPPPDAPRELFLLFDAIEQLCSAAHIHYGRMQAIARLMTELSLHADETRPAREAARAAIIADTGGLVGTLQRLRLLTRRLPGDSAIRVARKAFEATVRSLQPARHHLEHLDERIPDIAPTGHGAFGSVSWWRMVDSRTMKCVAIIPGTLAVGKGQAVTRVPSCMRGDVDHFWVVLGAAELNVSDAYWATVELEKRLRAWSEEQRRNGWPALRAWRYG